MTQDCEFTLEATTGLFVCGWCGVRRRRDTRRNCSVERPTPEHHWRPDAEQLLAAEFPLALVYDALAPSYEAAGETLRGVAEILERWAVCKGNECGKYDGRQCKLCTGCSGQGERKYLHQLTIVGGKCLADPPLWT